MNNFQLNQNRNPSVKDYINNIFVYLIKDFVVSECAGVRSGSAPCRRSSIITAIMCDVGIGCAALSCVLDTLYPVIDITTLLVNALFCLCFLEKDLL